MSEQTYLDRILAAKRAELAAGRRGSFSSGAMSDRQLEEALAGCPVPRDFIGALRKGPAPQVIAEFKRASPSAGAIREDANLPELVSSYEAGGAAALSVLTDRHFQGTLDDLVAARSACNLPILRKDFVLDRRQLLEARQAGADAVLLIVAALPAPSLKQLVDFAHDLELTVLCEAHDAHEIDRAMSAGCKLIGVNNRDLKTFDVDLNLSIELRKRVPGSFTFVAESGISSPEDLRRLQEAGVDAVLIGTTLMAADDPGRALSSLLDGLY